MLQLYLSSAPSSQLQSLKMLLMDLLRREP